MFLLFSILALFLYGCQSTKTDFNFPSPNVTSLEVSQADNETKTPNITIDFINCPLVTCLDYISRKTGISVYCSDEKALSIVTLSCTDFSLVDLLTLLSRSVSCDLLPVGNGYFIGPATENDRVVVTARLSGYKIEDLKNVLLNVLPGCSVSITPDGLCVVGCPVSSQARVRSALETLQVSRSLYRVRIAYVSNWLNLDLLDGSFTISANQSCLLKDWFWSDLFIGDFSLRIGGDILKTSVYSVDDYVCTDGGKVKIFRGSKQPIARHSVSDSGTNSVTGYDNIDIGDSLVISPLGQSDGSVLISLDIESSSVSGYVSDYPIKESNNLETMVRVNTGDIYNIGNFTYDKSSYGFIKFTKGSKSGIVLLSVIRLDHH